MSDSEDSDMQEYSQSKKVESEPEEEQIEEDLQRQKIRDNLSNLSFEELIILKEKLGSKVYNETFHGASRSQIHKKKIKRENKNRPREISSKLRMKKIRTILSDNNSSLSRIKSKDVTARDPRFDPSCGEFDKSIFKTNYKFVNELRQKEKVHLENEYKECTDPERKKTIKMLLQRMENQIREETKAHKTQEREEIEKKEIRERIKKGEKAVYKKKSVRKLEGLVEKYEEFKKTNRLEKHIQKRTKKLKVKDRKVMEKIKF